VLEASERRTRPSRPRIGEAPLPNLLVLIDLRDGVPTEPSLFALSEARRVAHGAGVTVFAVLLCDPRPEAEIERVAARLGVAGADKILLFERAGLDAPALDATHGALLQLAAERIPPLLFLFPAGGAGLQLGPALAARMGAAFAAAADLEVSDSPMPLTDSVGRVCLRRWRRDLSAYRRLDPVELERPVIAVLGAHGRSRDAGTPDVEIAVMETPAAGPACIVELASSVDEHAGIALARVIVVVGPTVEADVAAKLAAAAPPDVAVVELARVPPAALAVSTPRVILAVEAAANVAAPSPRTRLGLALAPTTDAATLGRADVAWRAASAAWDELVATLPRLSTPGGDHA
jgi:electron transfer flavoprotein alpha subunit